MTTPTPTPESIGDFYVHLVKYQDTTGHIVVDRDMTSSTQLLRYAGKPTVIHLYDGG